MSSPEKTVGKKRSSPSSSSSSASKPKRQKRVFVAPETRGAHLPSKTLEAMQADVAAASASIVSESKHTLKISSWNVNGINAILRRHPGILRAYVAGEKPDLLFLQETKLSAGKEPFPGEPLGTVKSSSKDSKSSDSKITAFFGGGAAAGGGGGDHGEEKEEGDMPDGYRVWWSLSKAKKGYSGTAVFVRNGLDIVSVTEGIGEDKLDQEGRVLNVELGGPWKNVVAMGVYTPNSGQKLERLEYRTKEWDVSFRSRVQSLAAAGKEVIVCGDLNVAEKDWDVMDPGKKANRSAGFCDDERTNFGVLLKEGPLVDPWRERHPTLQQFTFFSMRGDSRAQNVGWHLDYAICSPSLAPKVKDAFIRHQVFGSDHIPVGILLETKDAE